MKQLDIFATVTEPKKKPLEGLFGLQDRILEKARSIRTRLEGPCAHDRIRHESKSKSVCAICGVRMERHRGDWIAARSSR